MDRQVTKVPYWLVTPSSHTQITCATLRSVLMTNGTENVCHVPTGRVAAVKVALLAGAVGRDGGAMGLFHPSCHSWAPL
jgi:hypothetical protein